MLIVGSFSTTIAQQDSTTFKKTGFSFGALPVIAYDNDLGLQYGVLTNLYWYGDGSNFPRYDHSLYLEVSRYVAGTMLTRAYFDSHKLHYPDGNHNADLVPDFPQNWWRSRRHRFNNRR